MKSKSFNIIFVSVVLAGLMGCSEELLDEKPPHLITTETLYVNLVGFESGLNGIYALVRGEREGRTGSNSLRADVFMTGTDNMVPNHSGGFSQVAERWNTLNGPFDPEIGGAFEWLYQIVNAANTVINQAEGKDDVDWSGGSSTDEENKNRVIAEAKALRAWAYRHLTFGWGDVPLSLEESLGSNLKTDWERTSVEQVREQMEDDWLFAEQHLDVEPPVKGKISKGAVQHYLAELYLTMNRPDLALEWADKCINTPEYQLITQRYGVKSGEEGVPFMDMFYEGNTNREEGNTEALWVWQWEYQKIGGGGSIMRRWQTTRYETINVGGVRPFQYTIERGGRGIGRMAPSKWAIDLYEDGDDRGSNYAIRKFFVLHNETENAPAPADRLPPGMNYGDTVKLSWTNDITAGNRNRLDWPFSRKYDSTIPTNLQETLQYNDQVYLRLAETYLIKAEAEFLLGLPDAAAETINVIRRRSNASEVTGADIDLDFILEERSRELLFEEHRRHTLVRTGTWLERVKLYNKNGGQVATERDALFPIPQSVIDANLTSAMPQNAGYN